MSQQSGLPERYHFVGLCQRHQRQSANIRSPNLWIPSGREICRRSIPNGYSSLRSRFGKKSINSNFKNSDVDWISESFFRMTTPLTLWRLKGRRMRCVFWRLTPRRAKMTQLFHYGLHHLIYSITNWSKDEQSPSRLNSFSCKNHWFNIVGFLSDCGDGEIGNWKEKRGQCHHYVTRHQR